MNEINKQIPRIDEFLSEKDLEQVVSGDQDPDSKAIAEQDGPEYENSPLSPERSIEVLKGLEDLSQDPCYGLQKSLIIANSLMRSPHIAVKSLAITQKRSLVYQQTCQEAFKAVPSLKDSVDLELEFVRHRIKQSYIRDEIQDIIWHLPGSARQALLGEQSRHLIHHTSLDNPIFSDVELLSLTTTKLANRHLRPDIIPLFPIIREGVCDELQEAIEYYMLKPFIKSSENSPLILQLDHAWRDENLSHYQPIDQIENPDDWQKGWQSNDQEHYDRLAGSVMTNERIRLRSEGLLGEDSIDPNQSFRSGLANNFFENNPDLIDDYNNLYERRNEGSKLLIANYHQAEAFIASISSQIDKEATLNPELYQEISLRLQRYFAKSSSLPWGIQKSPLQPKLNIDKLRHFIARQEVEESLFPRIVNCRYLKNKGELDNEKLVKRIEAA